MFISILCLLLLFVAGFLMSSNYFPKKVIFAWFNEFLNIEKKNNGSLHAAVGSSRAVADDAKENKNIKSSSRAGARNNRDDIRCVFATFDKNNDGFITKQELRDSLKNIGMAMEENDVADIINNLDSNGDGLIDLDEFSKSFASLLGREEMNHKEEGSREANSYDGNDMNQEEEQLDKEGALKEAFDVFDEDKDGLITVEELGLVLSSLGFREGKKLEDCKEMIRKVDMDGDGMVNFDEFKLMMRAGQKFIPVA